MAQAKRRRKRKIFSPVYLTLVLIVLYLPILMVVIYSFNSGRTIGSWQGFTTDWYSRLFSNALMADALKNSLVLAVVSSLLAGGIGTLRNRAGAVAPETRRRGRNHRHPADDDPRAGAGHGVSLRVHRRGL